MPTGPKPPLTPLATALRMLARRPYSVAEMRRALERKFGSGGPVEAAIARLREVGYLDDKKFAALYASSLARNRNLGRHRVRRELKSKLVDYRTIEPALDAAFAEVDEQALLERAVARKVQSIRRPVTPARIHSLVQSLMRRGFRADDIMKAVRARPELKPVAEDVVPDEENSEL
ncbi:MAG TPA: RecX family transcriptional regulator [Terriglobia bacterium]|nr:RecX family transcriptional regulator [Terriglobia bacterium]